MIYNVKFVTPGYGYIRDNGFREILDNTHKFDGPFAYLLSARWYHAAESSTSQTIEVVEKVSDDKSSIFVISDFFYEQCVQKVLDEKTIRENKIFVFSDCPPHSQALKSRATPYYGYMNMFNARRQGEFSDKRHFDYQIFAPKGGDHIFAPMGCASSWLPRVIHYDKIIMLDEPHISLIESMSDPNDFRSTLFRHAVDVCKILHDRGFRILTFSRNTTENLINFYNEHPFLERIQVGGWIPFSEMVRHYGVSSLFYSYFPETFGYSVYENLQLGNGVITYSETYDPYLIKQMQLGSLLSVFMSPQLSADMICEYFDRYVRNEMRDIIRTHSYRNYATETFGARVIAELKSINFNNQ